MMATTVIKTVKPSGGDYTSLSAWEAGEQRDLVALNEIAVAECYSLTDTTVVVFNGFTTDSTHYIDIRAAAGQSYSLDVASGYAVNSSEFNIRFTGLTIHSGNSRAITGWTGAGTVDIQISKCTIKGNASLSWDGYCQSPDGGATSGTFKFWDNIIYDVIGAGARGLYLITAAVSYYVYNNTIVNCYTGLEVNAGTVTAKNNISYNSTGNDYTGTFAAGSSYNLSSDATAPGTNSKINQTVTFVNEAAGDFHLASGDTAAKDAGVDLSADPNLAFSIDIDGETRAGTWDIGADEYAAGGGGIPVSGNSIAGAAYSGVLISDLAVGGAVASISSASALAGLTYSLTGTLAGVSLPSAGVFILKGVGGSINGLSVISGLVTTSAITGLAGSINAISVLNGGFGLVLSLSGPTAGISSLFAGAGVLGVMQGAISGVSFLTANITSQSANNIYGSINALSAFSGGVAMWYVLGGSSVSSLLISGLINEVYFSSGVVSAASSLTGLPLFIGELSPASLVATPRFDVTRYGGGGASKVQTDSATATVTQDNINPGVTR